MAVRPTFGDYDRADRFTVQSPLSCVTPLPTGITVCGFGPTNTSTLSVFPTVVGTNTNLRVNVANGDRGEPVQPEREGRFRNHTHTYDSVAINVGVPVISSIPPSTGAWGQTVTITGAAFDPIPGHNARRFQWITSQITPASTTVLNVVVLPYSSTGNVTVTTFAASNAVPFTGLNLVPSVNTVTPKALTAGSLATIIDLSGTDFVPGASVQLDGADISTNFVSPTQITATVTQPQAASAHVYALTVFNPAPGGGTSTSSNFESSTGVITKLEEVEVPPPGAGLKTVKA